MISPDTAHASGCVVRGPGARQAVSGEPAFFTILSRDRYGNTVRSGGNEFRAEVHVKGPYEKDVVPCSVTDEGNGVYEGSYTVQIGGRHELHLSMRGQALAGSPFELLVHSGETYAPNCEVDTRRLQTKVRRRLHGICGAWRTQRVRPVHVLRRQVSTLVDAVLGRAPLHPRVLCP